MSVQLLKMATVTCVPEPFRLQNSRRIAFLIRIQWEPQVSCVFTLPPPFISLKPISKVKISSVGLSFYFIFVAFALL